MQCSTPSRPLSVYHPIMRHTSILTYDHSMSLHITPSRARSAYQHITQRRTSTSIPTIWSSRPLTLIRSLIQRRGRTGSTLSRRFASRDTIYWTSSFTGRFVSTTRFIRGTLTLRFQILNSLHLDYNMNLKPVTFVVPIL
jgi:hypothetical protein